MKRDDLDAVGKILENLDLENYEPYSRPLGELYGTAARELLKPYPAIHLGDWKWLNELTGGFRMREFTILCGATGSGKTTLLSHWAKAFMKLGKRCFVMSVETGHTDFIKRVMSAFAGTDLNQGSAVSEETIRLFHSQFGHFFTQDGLFLSLYDNRVSHETVIEEIEYHRVKKKCEIVFIDNLNFLLDVVSERDVNQIALMDRVVHDLIMYSKRTDVHIVMVMHPKKTTHGRVESEFDIKGSSTAVQEAYNIFLFNRPRKKDTERTIHDRELTISKLRRKGHNIGRSLWLKYENGRYFETGVADTMSSDE